MFAPADGYYAVHADYASTASSTLGLDGDTAVTLASTSGSLTGKTLKLYLRVTSGVDTTGATTYRAEAATRAGAAAVANNTWASGGKYVGSIGNGSGNTPPSR